MEISNELMNAIAEALLKDRERYSGADGAYAKTHGISGSVFSRLKKGERQGLLSQMQWLNIGRKLGVTLGGHHWNAVETDVYLELKDDFNYCQKNAKALMLVDDCGIGKTYCSKILVGQMQNAFYIDASQYKSKRLFIKALAREIGCGTDGNYSDMLENIKYYINALGNVFICIDEAGDLDYPAFLELKGLINGTTGRCGWYMIGADGLKAKIQRGINNHKVGYREIFSRFNNKFMRIVPSGYEAKEEFYQVMISEVLVANLPEELHYQINDLVPKILGVKTDKKELVEGNELGCLRRAGTFVNLILQNYEKSLNAQ